MTIGRRFIFAVAVLLGGASPAHAATTMVARDLPLHGTRSLASTPSAFDLVGVHWRGSGSVSFRTRSLSGRWSAWRNAAPEREDAPDASSPENRLHGWQIGNPWWTGDANSIQIRTRGRVTRVRGFFVDAPVEEIPLRRLSIAGSPPIVTRAQWEANESIRRAGPRYAPVLRFALVHHTAGPSGASPAAAAAIVRGIETYHVKGNGWDDIGYNFLVDRWGNVYEGRFGGVDKNVIGAHALGFNTGSVGVALIGTYTSAAPSAAQLTALEKLLAWRFDVAHIDPLSTVVATSSGNEKFSAGTTVALRAISGHRDTGSTECPGNLAYAKLGTIARATAASGGPKLYSPAVRGTLGGPIRFSGRLSASLAWTVTIRDAGGRTVAVGSGTGTTVDWTWDSRGAPPGSAYTWVIAAGPTLRPASGSLGAKVAALTLTGLTATPPRVDGAGATSTTIAYTLSVPANVTGELVNSAGTAVTTLFREDKPAGSQSFVFTAAGVPDGNYTIRLTAHDGYGRTAKASVAIVVSETLLRFATDMKVVSPNGDGRRDAASFTVALAQPANVSLALAARGLSIPLFQLALQPGEQQWRWTGLAADGSTVRDGAYRAVLTVGDPPLAVSQSVPLAVDTTPPRIVLLSLSPLRVRINEPATITAIANGRRIQSSVKPGIWTAAYRKPVRTLRLSARDAGGNDSRVVTWPRRG